MLTASLMHLGDVRLTAALAGTVAILLLMAKAYRAALWWCCLIGTTFGLVAGSKIMFLAWGLHSSLMNFKAISGHAAGAAAVLPIVAFLVAQQGGRAKQGLAILTGVLVSIGVVASLVYHAEHTPSEALAGWLLGTSATICSWMRLRSHVSAPTLAHVIAALAGKVAIGFCMQFVPIGWWLVKLAMAVSGSRQVHAWTDR